MPSLKKESPWHARPAPHPVAEAARLLAAALLMVASATLARFAALVAPAAAAVDDGSIDGSNDPRFEFHADAGAPDGALYVDGELVGHLPGVRRL